MGHRLDFIDLRILEALGKFGPRNISKAARKLGMPPETVRKRLKRLTSQIFLRFGINIYHTNLGLKKALVFADATPGHEDLLFKCLKTHDFWIGLAQCYGKYEGCFGIYTIPRDRCSKFEQFLEEVEKLGVSRRTQVFWSTCLQTVHSKCNWFDRESQTWNFQWDNWIDEILTMGTELPYTLVDPDDFPVKGDEIDVFMLKELEKNAAISFADLAEMLGMSPQLVGYHYRKHLMSRNLIESFEVSVFHFGRQNSDVLLFILKFGNMEKLAKFALSLLDKPFVQALGKILGENALFLYLYLPRREFREFTDSLSKLIRKGLLESYQYVIQDLRKTSRQTISYEYFKDGSWVYDHEKHVKNLYGLVMRARAEK